MHTSESVKYLLFISEQLFELNLSIFFKKINPDLMVYSLKNKISTKLDIIYYQQFFFITLIIPI